MSANSRDLDATQRRGVAANAARILVVEDEQIVALELERRLTSMGHSVVGVVSSGQEAIEHVRRLQPQLVLMDIKLQGDTDGIEAADAIRNEADVPVVYLTAFADETTLQRAKLTEPYGYILKPFHERELHVIIEVSLYRHRVARELRESEAWRNALLQSMGDAVVATGPDGRVKFLNSLAEALTGWKEQEAAGRPLEEVLKVVQLPERRGGTWKDLPSKRLIARDGSARPIEAELTTIRDVTNTSLGTVSVFRDISERKRWQDCQRFMAAASGEVSSSLDREMILTRLAPLIARNLASWCVIHLCGTKGTLRVAAFAHRESEKNAFANQLVGGVVRNSDDAVAIHRVVRRGSPLLEVDGADGGWITAALGIDSRLAPALVGASAIIVPLTTRGQTLGTLSLVSQRDRRLRFTELDLALAEELGRRLASGIDNAQLYSDAQRAIRMREDVLAIVSHDLRNPLASILMTTQVLLQARGRLSEPLVIRNARIVQRNAESMSRLIDDLVDVASIDAGHLSLKLKRNKAPCLAADALSMFEGLASQHSIGLVSTPLPDVDLLCDRERVLQVFSNLIGNALKFSPGGRSIVVRGEARGAVAHFSVSDRAGGIVPDQVEHVFERYWQAPEARRKGSGLGLYIAKGIVEAHGGRIWVDSTPYVGSTFHFTIPLAEHAETSAPGPSGPSGP
jgi:PAS domain S-box-containing protein